MNAQFGSPPIAGDAHLLVFSPTLPLRVASRRTPNTPLNPRGLLRYHVGPRETHACFQAQETHARTCIAAPGTPWSSPAYILCARRSRCDTLIPESVAISPRYNKYPNRCLAVSPPPRPFSKARRASFSLSSCPFPSFCALPHAPL